MTRKTSKRVKSILRALDRNTEQAAADRKVARERLKAEKAAAKVARETAKTEAAKLRAQAAVTQTAAKVAQKTIRQQARAKAVPTDNPTSPSLRVTTRDPREYNEHAVPSADPPRARQAEPESRGIPGLGRCKPGAVRAAEQWARLAAQAKADRARGNGTETNYAPEYGDSAKYRVRGPVTLDWDKWMKERL